MSKSIITTQRGGSGSPWRIIPKEAQIGEICTLTGTAMTFGEVAYAAAPAATDIGGEDSYMLNVVRTAANPSDAQVGSGFVGVCQEVDGIVGGKKGAIEFGPATLLVSVDTDGATDLLPGDPLVTSETAGAAGSLVQPTGTGGHKPHKVVAVMAKKYAAAELIDGPNLVWVHFEGIHGFGAADSAS